MQVADDAGDLQGEPTVSFAGFRVDEVLNSIGDFTAVGRTADVCGLDRAEQHSTGGGNRGGDHVNAADRQQLPRRQDLRRPEHQRVPQGNHSPWRSRWSCRRAWPTARRSQDAAEGDLTIKGVTNRVAFDLQAQLVGDIIVAVGSSDVVFSDYGVTAPTAPVVVSVEDHGIMEFQLLFTR